MSPIKTLARETHFFATIFSKTPFFLFKNPRAAASTFFTKIQNLFLAQNKGINLFLIGFLRTFCS